MKDIKADSTMRHNFLIQVGKLMNNATHTYFDLTK